MLLPIKKRGEPERTKRQEEELAEEVGAGYRN